VNVRIKNDGNIRIVQYIYYISIRAKNQYKTAIKGVVAGIMMYISCCKERCVMLGTYIVENRATVRATAQQFKISKSTVHKDVTQSLRRINPALYEQVQKILNQNKDERHLRGGEATKQKYLSKSSLIGS
jgi:putative DeoR family transcriptional regulator (stage III sporulation protein D)